MFRSPLNLSVSAPSTSHTGPSFYGRLTTPLLFRIKRMVPNRRCRPLPGMTCSSYNIHFSLLSSLFHRLFKSRWKKLHRTILSASFPYLRSHLIHHLVPDFLFSMFSPNQNAYHTWETPTVAPTS